jgi:hypothetical protein
MTRVLGSRAAAALIHHGLRHDDVVRGLVQEIGITQTEAEATWVHVSADRPDVHSTLTVLR